MSDKTNSSKASDEQQFRILPHPDKPSEHPQTGAGLNSKLEAFRTPGPVIPDREDLIKAGPPASSEELAVRKAELNQ